MPHLFISFNTISYRDLGVKLNIKDTRMGLLWCAHLRPKPHLGAAFDSLYRLSKFNLK